MQILSKAVLSLLLSLTTLAAHAGPNLVQNGGFEESAFAHWSYTGDGFQVGADITGSPANHLTNVFFDGSVRALGFLRQDIGGLIDGATYKLTFEVQRWISAGSTVDNEIRVMFGSDLVWDESDVTTDWMTKEFLVHASGTTATLEFGNISADLIWGTQLDNIALELVADPPIGTPEPASLALMGAGLALIAARRRVRVR